MTVKENKRMLPLRLKNLNKITDRKVNHLTLSLTQKHHLTAKKIRKNLNSKPVIQG